MSINLSNWREPDHNTWAFQNVDKILNTQSIKKGSWTSTLEHRRVAFDDFQIESTNDTSLNLSAFLNYTETDGLIVLKDGKIVYEYYDRSNNDSSIHIIMSITKSISGLVAGILTQQGKLNVDVLVSTYIPEVQGTSYENTTVRQLLDMRSGIKYDDASPEYRRACGWAPYDSGDKTTDLHEFLSTFQASRATQVDGLEGDAFDYMSVNTDLLGWVLERASGKRFAELVSELIWQPMGAESDALIAVDQAGNARTAGGMCVTLRDLARVGRLVLEDGGGVIPSAWISDMLCNGSQEAFAAGPWKRYNRLFDSLAYRSYWLADSNSETLVGLGVHGQMIAVDRLNKIVMVKLSSQPSGIDVGKSGLTITAFKEFQRILQANEWEGELKN